MFFKTLKILGEISVEGSKIISALKFFRNLKTWEKCLSKIIKLGLERRLFLNLFNLEKFILLSDSLKIVLIPLFKITKFFLVLFPNLITLIPQFSKYFLHFLPSLSFPKLVKNKVYNRKRKGIKRLQVMALQRKIF